jgi:hypothetical protein
MNINTTTGIRYGVIAANNVPYLFDDILMNGTDNRYNAYRNELRIELETTFDDAFNDYAVNGGDVTPIQAACDAVNDYLNREGCDYRLDSADFDDDDDFDVDPILDELLECYETDSDGYDYSYECDGYHYELSSLGGAGIIFVIKSPFVAVCKQCSPCCPNAGDLDNIVQTFAEGYLAYCVDPNDINPDDDNRDTYVIIGNDDDNFDENADYAEFIGDTFKMVTLA